MKIVNKRVNKIACFCKALWTMSQLVTHRYVINRIQVLELFGRRRRLPYGIILGLNLEVLGSALHTV